MISEFVEDVARIGTIQVQTVPSQLILERSKDKQAQLAGVRNKSINDIKLKLVHTIKLHAGVAGCCFLLDGKLVLCDRSKKIFEKILLPQGEMSFEISMSPSYAFDVTCIDPETLAVSSDHHYYKQINIINVDTKLRRSLRTEHECYEIAHKDGSIMVCVNGKGVQKVNTHSAASTTIEPCKLSSWSYIDSSDNKLYYTNKSDHTVTCCDMVGNIIWTFKDEKILQDTYCIAVDNVGNVYTVNRRQNKLIVLSADRQQSRQFLSKVDGLREPCAIAYDKIKNRLCVASYDTNIFCLALYFEK